MMRRQKICCVAFVVCLGIVGIVGNIIGQTTKHLPRLASSPPAYVESVDLIYLELTPSEYWDTAKKRIAENDAVTAVQKSLLLDNFFLIPAYIALFLSFGLYVFFSREPRRRFGIAVIILAIAGAGCDVQENRMLESFVTNFTFASAIFPWSRAKWVLLCLAASAASPWFFSREHWTKWIGGVLAVTGLTALGMFYHWKFYYPAMLLLTFGLLLVGMALFAETFPKIVTTLTETVATLTETVATLRDWLFLYLPQNFSIFLFLAALWFLFVGWPRAIQGVESLSFPSWIISLNLHWPLKAVLIFLMFIGGVLLIYNMSILYYRTTNYLTEKQVPWLCIVIPLTVAIPLAWPCAFLPTCDDLIPHDVSGWIPFPFLWTANKGEGFWPLSRYTPILLPLVLTILGEIYHRRHYRPDDRPANEGVQPHWPKANIKFETWMGRTRGSVPKIGIILAGGGAKGVYQAGALKAIHEFLEYHGALEYVRVIAGTSIGAWNSLFWLADLVRAKPGERSQHEKWWSEVNMGSVVSFDWYLPFAKSSLLRTDPWEKKFDQIFGEKEPRDNLKKLWPNNQACPIHFYLTRTNVNTASLECGTNCVDPKINERIRFYLGYDPTELQEIRGREAVQELGNAMFASMALPPLFPYYIYPGRGEYLEDGGVIDNLPTIFGTEIDQCDLLFVLPLNASFKKEPNIRSILRRMMRVIDMRQGALERSSLELISRYNREHTETPVTVIAICPDHPLVVTTSEFWKANKFGSAFKLMYRATREILKRFDFAADQKDPESCVIHLVEREEKDHRLVEPEKDGRRKGRQKKDVEVIDFRGNPMPERGFDVPQPSREINQ